MHCPHRQTLLWIAPGHSCCPQGLWECSRTASLGAAEYAALRLSQNWICLSPNTQWCKRLPSSYTAPSSTGYPVPRRHREQWMPLPHPPQEIDHKCFLRRRKKEPCYTKWLLSEHKVVFLHTQHKQSMAVYVLPSCCVIRRGSGSCTKRRAEVWGWKYVL